MQDQATKLRRLVSRIAAVEGSDSRACRVVFSGAKGGVGTTTLAINAAIALLKHASRILLIDANPVRGDVATICRLGASGNGTAHYDLEDVLQARRDWPQAMTTGPGGVQVVPRFSNKSLSNSAGYSSPYQSGHQLGHQLVRRLDAVSGSFDFIVIDAGSCPLAAEAIWPAADQAVLVTTTDHVAVTDAYSMIKSLHRNQVTTDLHCAINKFVDSSLALDVANRLVQSCEKFLGISLTALPPIPIDSHIPCSQANGRMVTCAAPQSPSVTAIAAVVEQLASVHLRHH